MTTEIVCKGCERAASTAHADFCFSCNLCIDCCVAVSPCIEEGLPMVSDDDVEALR